MVAHGVGGVLMMIMRHMGCGFGKNIRRGWEEFSSYIRFEILI
jgi:hypothetical protein